MSEQGCICGKCKLPCVVYYDERRGMRLSLCHKEPVLSTPGVAGLRRIKS